MKRNGICIVGLALSWAVWAPAWAQDGATFFRVVSPTTTVVTAFRPDGMMVWSNAAVGVTGCVQRATTLLGSSNWVDIAGYTATDSVMVLPTADYLVVDVSAGPLASAYPVSYLMSVPAGGWTDEYKTTKMVFRRIPAGTFTMGSPTDPVWEVGRYSGEVQHQVTLTKGFYIGVFEVTQRQWELVMGNRPSHFDNSAYYDSRPVEKVAYNDIRGLSLGAGWPGGTAVDATSFLGVLRTKTGLATWDLPTEAQWEYACRAETATALNSGQNLTSGGQDANMAEVGRYSYNGGSVNTHDGDTSVGTAKVGTYRPNAWGLYDMHGNVWEWCLDWYGNYPHEAVTDPVGPASPGNRTMRGGTFSAFAWQCRSANRGNANPGSWEYSVGYGFRFVRTLP